jgi:prepilin-type N-terminal cleavage/methylation domain-containing protein
MKQTGQTTENRSLPSGFSLIELLVVVGIIMVLAAVAAPAIANWARNYQIRGATQALAGDIQTARNRAIAKNANLGVAIVVQDVNTYWTHVEDDQSPPKATTRQQLVMAAPVAEQSVRRRLPAGIEFALNVADCPALAVFAPADYGFRFNRLGAWCDPGGGGACPDVDIAGATTNAVFTVGAAGSTFCLFERQSGLSRTVTVTPGGRVMAQQ